jgi:predicted N-acetyltransferase YhbS
MSPLPPEVKLPLRRGPVEYSLGSEADHESVYQTLLNVFQGPEREEYLGSLVDPSYRPDQRLVVRIDGRIASHVYLVERSMRLFGHVVPIQGVMWVGTLAEYRGHGLAQNLMRIAATRARQKSFMLQFAATSSPQFFRSLGWAVCGLHDVGRIVSRNLPSGGEGPGDSRTGWHVRPWRQVELGSLMKLYEAQFSGVNGVVVRSEEYWRWMIGRKLAHAIWVACRGEKVLGYAFVKDHRVLELASDPEHPYALEALLGRVRSEAIERAYPEVIVHAPLSHPALTIIGEAGGSVSSLDAWEGEVSLVNVPEPVRLMNMMLPEFARRARAARVALPLELGIVVGDQRWMLHVAQSRATKLESERVGRRHLTLSQPALVRLLLGHHDIDTAIEEDGVEPSASTAIEAARVLFPRVDLWRSPLDSLTA